MKLDISHYPKYRWDDPRISFRRCKPCDRSTTFKNIFERMDRASRFHEKIMETVRATAYNLPDDTPIGTDYLATVECECGHITAVPFRFNPFNHKVADLLETKDKRNES